MTTTKPDEVIGGHDDVALTGSDVTNAILHDDELKPHNLMRTAAAGTGP